MKAGAFTPAIPATPNSVVVTFGRSMKAGAFTPAIRWPTWCASILLNEGGGFHPRNPVGDCGGREGGGFHPRRRRLEGAPPRSMKAGAFTPAIPLMARVGQLE